MQHGGHHIHFQSNFTVFFSHSAITSAILLATCSNIACFEASRMPEIIPVTAPTSALTGAPTRDVVAAALIPEDTEARTVLIVVNDASIAPVSL